jgi:glycosyltransferase involved in cell wall biosynthesis
MRIGFDAKRAFKNKTGLGNYSRFVLDALYKYRPENHYLAYTPKTTPLLFQTWPAAMTKLPDRWLDRKLSAYWRYSRITRQLSQDRIDVFHGLSHELPQGLRETGIRSVVTMHDLIFERLPKLFKPADRLIYRHKFKSACKRADAIIAISEQTKRDLVDLYQIPEGRISVIYQDCSLMFRSNSDSDQNTDLKSLYEITGPYVLSVGTLEERKNQHRLVEAFAALPANDFQLVLVGKATSYADKIRRTIQKHKLGKRVLILENVPNLHLPSLYRNAEVFAYISLYEGFGIPILEALHSGTPVLAAQGSCLEEAGGPGGLYADPLNVSDIGDKMLKLISDEGIRKQKAALGAAHILQFSGEKIALHLTDLYKSIR